MHRKFSVFVLSLCLTLPGAAAAAAKLEKSTKSETAPRPKASASAPAGLERDAAWKKDVRFLATELPRLYPEGFSAQTRRAWDAQAQRIENAVPKMSDSEVKVGLLRMIALLADSATRLQWSGERFFPMSVQSFPDGVRVTRVVQELERAVGARLVKIGDTPIDAAAKPLGELSACADDGCRQDALARYLTSAEILRALNLVPPSGSATFGFEDDAGRFSLELPASGPRDTNIGMWATAIDSSPEKQPLYMRHREENYWFELLPESKTVYVQYARSRPGSGKAIGPFADELFRAAQEKEIDRLVLDLRRNTATDVAFLRPFIDKVESKPALRGPGKLFVIVGPLTYPAGAENARELARRYRATIVGETVPARGRRTGESKSLVLPGSKLRVIYPTLSSGPPESKPLVPDLAIEPTFDSLKQGTDAALEAILAKGSKAAAAAK